MRIVAGTKKGLRLKTLEGANTRPTKDMVKEALFSSLGFMEGKSFLDLFAGSGAIGLEAKSRGAARVVMAEHHPQAIKIIKENIALTGFKLELYEDDYRRVIPRLKEPFDFIFLDPPYRFDKQEELMRDLMPLVHKKSVVIWEVEAKRELLDSYGDLHQYKQRRYGITKLVYYQKED